LVYLKSHHSHKQLGDLSQLEIDIPSLELEVHYDDMENSHYSEKFEVLFSIRSYWIHMVEKDVQGLRQVLTGSFEFKHDDPYAYLTLERKKNEIHERMTKVK